jgi:hypothetical protein
VSQAFEEANKNSNWDMYVEYFRNYRISTSIALRKKCMNVARNTHTAELANDPKFQDLESYRITPIQRLPRYKTFLEDLTKNTEPKDKALLV